MSSEYRGFTIEYEFPPIPIRTMDWSATSDDYDVSWEGPEDGGWKTSGTVLYAATRDELISMIDEYHDATIIDGNDHPSPADTFAGDPER
jgi:hypothetical protein